MKKTVRFSSLRCLAGLALFLTLTPGAAAQDTPAGAAVSFEMHAVADRPGPHTRVYLGVQTGADGKPENILLVDPPLLDSKAIRFVSVDYDDKDHPIILINLTENGSKRFEQITRDMIGKQLGLVIGGQLYSMPRIMETIHGGKIAISGSFTARQAANLAERLNASLPVKPAGR